MSTQRYVILVFVIAALCTGMVLQAASGQILEATGVGEYRILGGLLTTSALIGLVSGVGTFFALIRNKGAVRFTGEVIGELFKVVWPTRDEAMKATTSVILTTLFVASLLGVYDKFWGYVSKAFLGS